MRRSGRDVCDRVRRGNALSALITPHELGHSHGGLRDEYDYYARGDRGAQADRCVPAFKFTAEDTEIDQLVYGKLAVPQVVPWDDVPPGYGHHQIEYRAIDATGNIASCRANAPEPTNLPGAEQGVGPSIRGVREALSRADMDVSFADMSPAARFS